MYLAIDIGGTKTLCAVLDVGKHIVEQQKFPTNKDYRTFLQDVKNCFESFRTKNFKKCVCASPGAIDRVAGKLVLCGNLPWEGLPLRDDIHSLLNTEVYLENDAKLAALGEAVLLPEYRRVLYITVSTGIGGGLVIDGRLDPNALDAEYGRMLLEHEGKLALWEDFASGKAIVAKFGKRASEITDQRSWYIIARNIAIGLVDVIAATNPEVVVIGGGVGSHFSKFSEHLIEEVTLYTDKMLKVPKIVGAQHPEEAVVYGCFEYAKQHTT
jgi:predicted NBD/HSP70 family sugar kinase